MSGAEVDDDDGVGGVGDVVEEAGFWMSITRWGGVAKESTRPAVKWKADVSVLPSGVPLELSRTAVSEKSLGFVFQTSKGPIAQTALRSHTSQ